MKQSALLKSTTPGAAGMHVAVIMDGNGRWAKRRGRARHAGHPAGVLAARRIIEAALDRGVATLTLYAFSATNWNRAPEEVEGIFDLLRTYLHSQGQAMEDAGIRFQAIGRRDRLPAGMAEQIERVEAATHEGRRMRLRMAIDYSAREAISRAAANAARRWPAAHAPTPHLLGKLIALGLEQDCGEVDLLIRSGGDHRLSDFLLWECACAEIWFTDTLWPDFSVAEFDCALADYHQREEHGTPPVGAGLFGDPTDTPRAMQQPMPRLVT